MAHAEQPEKGDPPQPSDTPAVLLFYTDLMFGVQLQNMVKKAGLRPVLASPGASLRPAALLVVDLAARGDVEAVIREARAMGTTVVAFGPHMDTEARRMAKKAGARRVLANSNLARDLPLILADLKAND